jgi:lysozyme family protein
MTFNYKPLQTFKSAINNIYDSCKSRKQKLSRFVNPSKDQIKQYYKVAKKANFPIFFNNPSANLEQKIENYSNLVTGPGSSDLGKQLGYRK